MGKKREKAEWLSAKVTSIRLSGSYDLKKSFAEHESSSKSALVICPEPLPKLSGGARVQKNLDGSFSGNAVKWNLSSFMPTL